MARIPQVVGQSVIKQASRDGYTESEEKAKRILEYRREASRLASKANKRADRLRKSNLTNSPAYQKYMSEGGERFGVKGKTYNEVQAEVARLRGFLDSETSTIKGYNNVLKNMAQHTGVQYKNLKELRDIAPKFFELSSKVEQYLRTVEDMASAIGYQQIWEAVNEYIQANQVDLGDAEGSIEAMTQKVGDALANYEPPGSKPEGTFYWITND